jgi:hypothetical protein
MNFMSFGEYLYIGGFIQKTTPDHYHTPQIDHPTTTSDSTSKNYERQL